MLSGHFGYPLALFYWSWEGKRLRLYSWSAYETSLLIYAFHQKRAPHSLKITSIIQVEFFISRLTSWKDTIPFFWREEAALWANTAGQRSKDAASNVRIDVPMSLSMTITRAIPTKIHISAQLWFFGTEMIGSLIKHVIVFYLSCHKTTASFYGTEKQRVFFLSTVTWSYNALQQCPSTMPSLSLHGPTPVPRTAVDNPDSFGYLSIGSRGLKFQTPFCVVSC